MRSFYGKGDRRETAEIEKADCIATGLDLICSRSHLFVVFVFVAGVHAHFGVPDGIVGGLDGGNAVPALVMFGHFEVLFGLAQGLQSSLHVGLVIIVRADSPYRGHAEQSKNRR
jgi:hypothetical protein